MPHLGSRRHFESRGTENLQIPDDIVDRVLDLVDGLPMK
jgi:hypothetical protein